MKELHSGILAAVIAISVIVAIILVGGFLLFNIPTFDTKVVYKVEPPRTVENNELSQCWDIASGNGYVSGNGTTGTDYATCLANVRAQFK
jgi:hypothetical protein